MKKLFFAYAWLLLTAGVVLTGTAGISFFYLTEEAKEIAQNQEPEVQISSPGDDQVEPGEVKGVETVVEAKDSRPEIVANFLERYKSPLEPHDYFGKKLVEIADKYDIDFRLLPAIAMQESNLCKKTPPGTHNCLGFGIHSRGTLGFDSYEAGFERAAKELKANYIDQGRTTPQEIMKKYTPHSNGSWANSVNQWMAEMRYDDRSLGKKLKTNADLLEFIDNSGEINENDVE